MTGGVRDARNNDFEYETVQSACGENDGAAKNVGDLLGWPTLFAMQALVQVEEPSNALHRSTEVREQLF